MTLAYGLFASPPLSSGRLNLSLGQNADLKHSRFISPQSGKRPEPQIQTSQLWINESVCLSFKVERDKNGSQLLEFASLLWYPPIWRTYHQMSERERKRTMGIFPLSWDCETEFIAQSLLEPHSSLSCTVHYWLGPLSDTYKKFFGPFSPFPFSVLPLFLERVFRGGRTNGKFDITVF